ncbi:MAG: BamA/TamA family outer membrane protein [Bdellovibrionota bacterium]
MNICEKLTGALLALTFFLCCQAFAADANPFGESYPQYDGTIVSEIRVIGLKRSKETVVRWMLGAREGEPFNSKLWRQGTEHLYGTSSVYDIQTDIKPLTVDGANRLVITVHLQDKWTLFPYAEARGGGGSLAIEVGVFDTNFAGTFSQVSASAAYLDQTYSYDLNFLQPWVMGTDYSFGLDLAKIETPVDWQNHGGAPQEHYMWTRNQQQIYLGKHNGENVHLGLFAETLKDSLHSATGRKEDIIYTLQQYRLRPSIKFWQVSQAEYLEEGHELTLAGTVANPLHEHYGSYAAAVSWKDVYYLPESKNIAYFLSAGATSPVPVGYQFRLGGFDSVRGFETDRAIGRFYGRGNFEYRASVWKHKFSILDIDRVVLQGCAFSDVGSVWRMAELDSSGKRTQSGTRALGSVGLGIRAIFLHFSSAILRIDAARALFPNEGVNISFGIGQFF